MTNTTTHRATLTGGSDISGPRTVTISELNADGTEGHVIGTFTMMDGLLSNTIMDEVLKTYGLTRVGEWAPPSGHWSYGVLSVDLRRV